MADRSPDVSRGPASERRAWKRRVRRLARLLRLEPREFVRLLEGQWALLRAWRMVRKRPVGDLVGGGGVADAYVPPVALERARAVALAVERAAENGIGRPNCLVRAMAIQRMLERRGIGPSGIRVGARMSEGRFLAHAWVEVGGVILGDREENVRRFEPVTDLRLLEF